MRWYDVRRADTARKRMASGVAKIGEFGAIAALPRAAGISAEIAAGPTKHRWGRWWRVGRRLARQIRRQRGSRSQRGNRKPSKPKFFHEGHSCLDEYIELRGEAGCSRKNTPQRRD